MKPSLTCMLCLIVFVLQGSLASVAQQQLSLRYAIDLALKQNQEIALAHADDGVAIADARSARMTLLPKLSLTEDISRGNDPVYAFGTRLRQQQFTQADFALNALNRPQPIGNFSTRFSGSWVGFDSWKTQREIRRADLLRASSSFSTKAVDQQIVLQVVRAYQSVLYAQRQIDVAQHEQQTAAALLASVEERVQAGLVVESDRMSAQVNVAARKEELIAAQGDLEMAWAELRMAIGAAELEPAELKPLESHVFPELPLEQALISAAKTRPDLQSLKQTRLAQTAAVGAAKSDFGPRVSAYGNWEQDRTSFAGAGGNNWLAGVQISIDILPAGKRAQLAHESATQQRINAQLALAQQHVRLEVSKANIQRRTAELSLETAQAAIAQASESLRILNNRYRAGLATITDLLRAEDAERQSQSAYWRAVYGITLAYADQLYVTGMLTPEAAEELQ